MPVIARPKIDGIDFSKNLNQRFVTLQNVEVYSKETGGDFADLATVGLGKRGGTDTHLDLLGSVTGIRELYSHNTKSTAYHIGSYDTSIYRANGSVWTAIKTGLTSDKKYGFASINSYTGTALETGTFNNSITGTWTTVTYSASTGLTKLIDTSAALEVVNGFGAYTGMFLYPDTTNEPTARYAIVEHSATEISISGDISGFAAIADNYKIIDPTTGSELIDRSKSWTIDEHAGSIVVITGGTGSGQMRRIGANTATVLNVSLPWEKTLDSTSTYSIYSSEDIVLYFGNGVDNTQRWDITGGSVALPNIPKGDVFMDYQNRLIMAGDSDNPYSVYYSDIADPEYFSPVFVIRPPGEDKVKALTEWNGKGIIFKERSVWVFQFVFNTTTSTYSVQLEQIPSATGAIGPRAVTRVENDTWYFDGREVKRLGASPQIFGVITTDSVSPALNEELKKLNTDLSEDAVMHFDPQRRIVRLSVASSGSTFNDVTYEYDLRHEVWHKRIGNNIASLNNFQGQMYYGSSSTGQAYTMDSSTFNDAGSAIDMIIKTQTLEQASSFSYKTYRAMYLEFLNTTFSDTLFRAEVQNLKTTMTVQEKLRLGWNVGAQGSGSIGSLLFGKGAIGGNPAAAPLKFKRKKSINRQGQAIQITIQNDTLNQSCILTAIEIDYFYRPRRHFNTSFIS